MKSPAILIIVAALLVAIPTAAAAASSSQNAMKSCSTQWSGMGPDQKLGKSRANFMSGCLHNGGVAPSTAGDTVGGVTSNMGAAATNTMHGATHAAGDAVGNVTGAATSAGSAGMASVGSSMSTTSKTVTRVSHSKIPVEGNTGTSARCNDGTTMAIHTHSGACSHHGGVAAWL